MRFLQEIKAADDVTYVLLFLCLSELMPQGQYAKIAYAGDWRYG